MGDTEGTTADDGWLEVWAGGTRERFALRGDRVTLGASASNDVALSSDRTVSRVHAVLEKIASRWCARDLSSTNGTFVNGERIFTERPLGDGDEVRVGNVRLLVHLASGPLPEEATIGPGHGPDLTRREREVLVALCRPMFSGDVFREPATVRQIAAALVVTDAAVKQHLSRLYDKFGLTEEGEGRRTKLANEAIRRGSVSTAEIARTMRDPT